MSDAIENMRRTSVALNQRTHELGIALNKAAKAESDYRKIRAKTAFEYQVRHDTSAAKAAQASDADDTVAEACFLYKSTQATAKALSNECMALRREFDSWEQYQKQEAASDSVYSRYGGNS